ncbi:hypothetical protein IWQ60_006399 [Tieghemiomyces parasiticus]|uniref:GTP-binding protein 8 n=1 Tax=Tieghemiomyces parasiticus TaxID=78921 RepID=A0A9W8DY07_9FUNG|nr:hypothetical protein IWQ60_006399 [Tieghemiomyces parasiticus]
MSHLPILSTPWAMRATAAYRIATWGPGRVGCLAVPHVVSSRGLRTPARGQRTNGQPRSQAALIVKPDSVARTSPELAQPSLTPDTIQDPTSCTTAPTKESKTPVRTPNHEHADRIFRKPAFFIKSATTLKQINGLTAPEVVFLGRSNVGKSSLINALVNRKGLVKTSSKPGHTSLMNFFGLAPVPPHSSVLTLVDMPGYGFRSRREWGKFILSYLSERNQLCGAYMLIDSKVGELKSSDHHMIELLTKHQIPFQVVLTKADKAKETDPVVKKLTAELSQKSAYFVQPIMPVSARKKLGLTALRLTVLMTCNLSPSAI